MDAIGSAPIIITTFFGTPYAFKSTPSIDSFIKENQGGNPIFSRFQIVWPDKKVQNFDRNWDLKDLESIKNIFTLPTQEQRDLVASVVKTATETFNKLVAERNASMRKQKYDPASGRFA
jgi:hypothetical protein